MRAESTNSFLIINLKETHSSRDDLGSFDCSNCISILFCSHGMLFASYYALGDSYLLANKPRYNLLLLLIDVFLISLQFPLARAFCCCCVNCTEPLPGEMISCGGIVN